MRIPRLRRTDWRGWALLAIAVLAGGSRLAPARAQEPARELVVAGRNSEHVTAAARDRFVALAWAGTSRDVTDIYSAFSRDGGATFSAPSRVNSTAGEARANGEQPPRVALVPRGADAPDVVVVWAAPGKAGNRLLTARSTDGARTFGTASVVPGAEAAGNRGWHSIAVDDGGRAFALWLDHRKLASTASSSTHQHAGHDTRPPTPTAKEDAVARAGQSELFFASLDSAIAPRGLTGGVCYCCKTALTAAGGRVYAAWRHVYPGNQRDIAFTVSHDGGRTFASPLRVSEDRWQFDGCPENGPAMAVDASQRVHAVWPTLISEKGEETMALFYARSTDGRAFSPRVRIPTGGSAFHPQVAAQPDGALLVAWEQPATGGRRIAAVRIRPDAAGRPAFSPLGFDSAPAGVYPAVAVTPGGGLIAWTRRTSGDSVIALARVRRSG